MTLSILADENMPGLEPFEEVARVERMPGRTIRAEHLRDKQVLLVRSVTPVNAALLAGTPVRFVGSATIGTDHVDIPWLEKQGVTFAHAPGCNATAVAEYVLQAVFDWLVDTGREPASLTAAVVGCGNVGSRVARLLHAAGLSVRVCDPPRQRGGDVLPGPGVDLRRALEADVVTLHVPLTDRGADATRHLLDGDHLDRMRAGQLVLNTSRGAVIDNRALERRLETGGPDAVLDVWEDEPLVPPSLYARVRYGTPHIAGYSVEGKLRGSAMVLRAFCDWRGLPVEMAEILPPAESWSGDVRAPADVLALLRHRYDLRLDHRRLGETLNDSDPAAGFDGLRRHYRRRHECAQMSVSGAVAPEWEGLLSGLGVRFGNNSRTVPERRKPAEPSLR